MAITLPSGLVPQLTRSATFLDLAQDFTRTFWIRWGATPFGANVTDWVLFQGTDYSQAYFALSAGADETAINIEIYDGVNYLQLPLFAVMPDTWQTFAVVYRVGTTTVECFLDAVSLGTLTVDLASAFGSIAHEWLGGDAGFSGNVSVEYERIWQAALGATALATEFASVAPARTSNLLSSARLAAAADLTDPTGGHDWSLTAGGATYLAGPLPPANTTPLTATVITSLPYHLTVDVQDAPAGAQTPSCSSSPLHSLWFVYTPVANGPTVLGVTIVDPDTLSASSAWLGPAAGPTQITNACSFLPSGLQFNLTVGVPVYLLINSESLLMADSLEITIEGGATLSAPAGSFLITNDKPGFPATVLRASDLSILWSLALPSSEMADTVPTGQIGLLAEGTNANLAVSMNVYNQNFDLLAANTAMIISNQSSISPVRSNGSNRFYVLCQTSVTAPVAAPILKTISNAGVAGPTWTLPILTVNPSTAMAPNRIDSIVYYAERRAATTTKIHAYDLAGSAALPDLVTITTFTPGRDLLILASTDLLLAGTNTTNSHAVVKRIDTAGVVQATYDLGVNVASAARIALGQDDPDSFWGMSFPASGVSRFQQIDVSTGLVLFSQDCYSWEAGGSNHGLTFGPSQSCPLVLLSQVATPPSPVVMITYPARRLRRFALPFDQNKWIFIHRLEFIMQTGVGLISGQGSDPVVMMRLSRDGGETWGPEREMSIGKMGAYKWRVFTNRLGRARNPVVELTVSDPVMLAFMSCTADLESGTS